MKLNIENYSLSKIETILTILFGENWKDAEIEKRDYPFNQHTLSKWCYGWSIDEHKVYNNHSLIYDQGDFATRKLTELPEKFITTDEAMDSIFVYHNREMIDETHLHSDNILSFKGYQYLTYWQLEELQNKPKVGDFGVTETGVIGELKSIKMGAYVVGNERFENFTPIKNKEHIEIIKSYLK